MTHIPLESQDESVRRFVLSLASGGNLRTTTIKVFSEAEFERIIGALV